MVISLGSTNYSRPPSVEYFREFLQSSDTLKPIRITHEVADNPLKWWDFFSGIDCEIEPPADSLLSGAIIRAEDDTRILLVLGKENILEVDKTKAKIPKSLDL